MTSRRAASASGPPPATDADGGRGWFWAQLLIGWTPVLALYATILVAMHGGSVTHALLIALRAIGAAALLGVPVVRLVRRVPWPRPVRPWFVLLHVASALAFSVAWVALVTVVEYALALRVAYIAQPGLTSFLIMGVWLYVAVAGVSYAATATARAARAEAAAARSQLAALRGQLNPHFLFNALHTVVQLIPVEPARAAEAAELLAGLLRSASDTERDRMPLAEERRFVERYLALEALRFGDRLRVRWAVPPSLDDALVPSFTLQTLVENAVRHGAAPREEATTVTITAEADGGELRLAVRDDGAGPELPGAAGRAEHADGAGATAGAGGTGHRRLRERLAALHGAAAALELAPADGGTGYVARVRLPLERDAAGTGDARD